MTLMDKIQCRKCSAKLELHYVSTNTPGWKDKVPVYCSECGEYLKQEKTDGDIQVKASPES